MWIAGIIVLAQLIVMAAAIAEFAIGRRGMEHLLHGIGIVAGLGALYLVIGTII
jgi:hypothetical protein